LITAKSVLSPNGIAGLIRSPIAETPIISTGEFNQIRQFLLSKDESNQDVISKLLNIDKNKEFFMSYYS
jgi:hypothetical protein